VNIEFHDRLGSPQHSPDCTRAVIYDAFHNPILIVLEHAGLPRPQYFIKAAGQPGFERALESLGIRSQCITEVLGPEAGLQPPGRLVLPTEVLPNVDP
jgi:hypothetical protein